LLLFYPGRDQDREDLGADQRAGEDQQQHQAAIGDALRVQPAEGQVL